MASKSTTTVKDIETVEEVEALELLDIVDAAIKQVVAAHGINIQKARYKAMRAIAWQAFTESIEAGDFEALTERAIANAGNLPSGWELQAVDKRAERTGQTSKAAPTPKAPATKTARKAPAKRTATATKSTTATTAAPKRTARKSAAKSVPAGAV